MIRKVYLLCIISCFFQFISYSQVGIGATTPNASAILKVQSTAKVFLPPRLSTAERDS